MHAKHHGQARSYTGRAGKIRLAVLFLNVIMLLSSACSESRKRDRMIREPPLTQVRLSSTMSLSLSLQSFPSHSTRIKRHKIRIITIRYATPLKKKKKKRKTNTGHAHTRTHEHTRTHTSPDERTRDALCTRVKPSLRRCWSWRSSLPWAPCSSLIPPP